jgi:nucleoside-diphosphate kinase
MDSVENKTAMQEMNEDLCKKLGIPVRDIQLPTFNEIDGLFGKMSAGVYDDELDYCNALNGFRLGYLAKLNMPPNPNSRFTCGLIKTHIVQQSTVFKAMQHDLLRRLEEVNLKIATIENLDFGSVTAGKTLCERFYAEHRDKSFFEDLKRQQTGPVVAMILESTNGGDAITMWRNLIGDTDPTKDRSAGKDTLRAHYGESKELNAFHGSDSISSAFREIQFFCSENQLNIYLSDFI